MDEATMRRALRKAYDSFDEMIASDYEAEAINKWIDAAENLVYAIVAWFSENEDDPLACCRFLARVFRR